MSTWTYEDIRIATNAGWVIEPKGDTINYTGVAIDTRAMQAGQVFFAFIGEQVDGHAYLRQAVKGDASMCIVTDASKVPSDLGVPVLVVDEALFAITAMACAWRERINATVIAITGSNGKTTTCRFVHALCAQRGLSYVSQKSFNNELGVPITILNTPSDAKYLVAELGTSSPGEIAARTALVKPDIAVITSIGSAHLEELGDRSGVAKEKSTIINALPDDATAVIIGGIAELEEAIGKVKQAWNIIRVDADRVATSESASGYTPFTLDGVGFTVPMLGIHNAMNAAMAIEVGRALGFADELIRVGLMNVRLPEMRLERIEIETTTDPIVVYNDAYNANPDSMRAALSTFESLNGDSPKIAILGDMLELGTHTQAQHAALIQMLSQYESISRFILVGQAFKSTGLHPDRVALIESIDDDAMNQIASMIDSGSCVLLKGSRGIRLERIVQVLSGIHTSEPIVK